MEKKLKPPTPKPRGPINHTLEWIRTELEKAQRTFDLSEKNNWEGASEQFRVNFIRAAVAKAEAELAEVRNIYAEELFEEKPDKWPRKGMRKDAKVMAVFSKYSFLAAVLNYLQSQMSQRSTEALQKRIPKDKWHIKVPNTKGEIVDRELALFSFDNYDEATDKDKVNCSESTFKKYIAALCDMGAIQPVYGGRRLGPKIYAFGYWVPVKTEDREFNSFIPFLQVTDKEIMERFINLNLK